MPRRKSPFSKTKCTICKHPQRALIEAARVVGCSLDSVAAKYECSRDALFRHMKEHVSDDDRAGYLAAQPLTELAEAAAKENLSVIEFLQVSRALLWRELQLAANLHDRHAHAALHGRFVETCKLLASLTGELMQLGRVTINNNVTVSNSPQLQIFSDGIKREFKDDPSGFEKVMRVIREVAALGPTEIPALVGLEQADAAA